MSECEMAVKAILATGGIEVLVHPAAEWVKYRCLMGEPATHIAEDLLGTLLWLDICKALKLKYPSLPDSILLEIKMLYMSGSLVTISECFAKADELLEKLNNTSSFIRKNGP